MDGDGGLSGLEHGLHISVTLSACRRTLALVNKGIDCIKKPSVNPDRPGLYRNSADFQHKLGNIRDDAQRFYKWQMALQWIRSSGTFICD